MQGLASKHFYSVFAPASGTLTPANFRCPGHMRTDRQVVDFEERAFCVQRLDLRHVDSGGNYLAGLKRLLQSRLVNQRTPGAVDEYRRRLHLSERVDVENMVRLDSCWRVNGDEVRFCKQRVEIDQLNAEKVGRCLRYVRVVRNDFFRTEPAHPDRKRLADTAQSKNTDRGAGYPAQLPPQLFNFLGPVRPRTALQRRSLLGDLSGDRKQHRHCVIGDFAGVDSRGVGNADSKLGRGVKID